MECPRLRVKDVDFGQDHLLVRDGQGAKDRTTLLPVALVEPLRQQVATIERVHRRDLAEGFGRVPLPDALDTTFTVRLPAAPRPARPA